MIKTATWLMMASLISSFMLIPAKSASAATVYKYEWVSQSGTVSPDGKAHQYTNVVPGQTISLWLSLINRSGTTIQRKGSLPLYPPYLVPVGSYGIGTQNPQDGTPYFLDSSSFVLNNNRFVYYNYRDDVPDLGRFTMNWNIKLANNLSSGVYRLYVRPVSEYNAWTRQYKNGRTLPGTNSDIFWEFVVNSTANWQQITNTALNFTISYPEGYGVHGIGMLDDPYNSDYLQVYSNTNPSGNIEIKNLSSSPPSEPTGFEGLNFYGWADKFAWANRQYKYEISDYMLASDLLAGKSVWSYKMKGGVCYNVSCTSFNSWPPNEVRKVFLVENNRGDKIAISYTYDNATLAQIVQTIIFN